MKLFELLKLMVQQTSGFHARALRVIGQDLAAFVPENIAIELQGDSFVAHGLCAKTRMEDRESSYSLCAVKKFFKRMATMLQPPLREPDLEFVPFTRTYKISDLEHLDDHAIARRGNPEGMPDIYTLGERLRTIGKVIDGHDGRVIRIFKDLHQIVFEYRDGNGQVRKEELTNTELYQLQQSYAARRGSVDSGN
ncbi:MAG TPA: hypothetical protein VH851_02505 [Candidatus Binatia bacterium]